MAIDSAQFGAVAAEFMEQLENEFGPDATLSHFMFVAAVDHGDDVSSVKFSFRNGDGTPAPRYVGKGLAAEVEFGLNQ